MSPDESKDLPKTVQSAWDKFRLNDVPEWKQIGTHRVEQIIMGLALGDIPSSPAILDYGCNSGIVGIGVAARLNASSLTQADLRGDHRRSDVNGLTLVPFLQIPDRDLPVVTDKKFDLILLSDVLAHVSVNKRIELLRGLIRNLTERGKVIISQYHLQHKEVIEQFRDGEFTRALSSYPELQRVKFIIE